MKSLGIDIGTSFVKVSLLDVETGNCLAACSSPKTEMHVKALKPGWAEQDPLMWWKHVCICLEELHRNHTLKDVKAIGITYQMHGLVCVNSKGMPLRDAIIWSDSRAVEIGATAFQEIGEELCLTRLLNAPGNFTASKMAWVRKNEPDVFAKTHTFFLPGDFIAFQMTGYFSTTESGLSEQVLWDFRDNVPARFVLDYYGIPVSYLPHTVPSMGRQANTTKEMEDNFGIPRGTPVSYRAGDQLNNAFSLNVMETGEIAATAGTSGVVYGITDKPMADSRSRVNQFLHVNHTEAVSRYGMLLCINGTGILNAWIRKNLCAGMTYEGMNTLASEVPSGSEGVLIVPFGNGAERMLENRLLQASVHGLDLNRHKLAHLLRAAQEGIAFSFRYGMDIMKETGMDVGVIRAGKANLFLSSVFRSTLTSLTGTALELYNTDGSLGAARGAALGAGLYPNREACFSGLSLIEEERPVEAWVEPLEKAYLNWKERLYDH